MNILTITAPQYEPISIADVTEAWGISGDDARVTKLIKEARQWAEGATGRALMAQRRELRLLDWPCDAIRIYCRPARAIVSIKYIDSAGTENTWDAANYALDTAGITPNETDSNAPALVRCAYGVSWPTATLSPTDPIRVQFDAGYSLSTANEATQQAAVPEQIREAILRRVKWLYDHRDVSDDVFSSRGTTNTVDMVEAALLAPLANYTIRTF